MPEQVTHSDFFVHVSEVLLTGLRHNSLALPSVRAVRR
jgi:hypothetical protein